ncbi:hypothetical protein T484DRAFT_3344542, partial [Baffinella frigidus]
MQIHCSQASLAARVASTSTIASDARASRQPPESRRIVLKVACRRSVVVVSSSLRCLFGTSLPLKEGLALPWDAVVEEMVGALASLRIVPDDLARVLQLDPCLLEIPLVADADVLWALHAALVHLRHRCPRLDVIDVRRTRRRGRQLLHGRGLLGRVSFGADRGANLGVFLADSVYDEVQVRGLARRGVGGRRGRHRTVQEALSEEGRSVAVCGNFGVSEP